MGGSQFGAAHFFCGFFDGRNEICLIVSSYISFRREDNALLEHAREEPDLNGRVCSHIRSKTL